MGALQDHLGDPSQNPPLWLPWHHLCKGPDPGGGPWWGREGEVGRKEVTQKKKS